MPLGIPYTTFLGRDEGPAWTEDDQDAALAWQREKALVCPSCGTRDDEWVRRDATGEVVEELEPYEPTPIKCHGCGWVEDKRSEMQEAGADMAGVRVVLRRA